MTKWLRNLLAMAVLARGVAVPVAGQRPALAMLDQLERGRWEIRMRDEDRTVRSLCLGDGRRRRHWCAGPSTRAGRACATRYRSG